GFGTAALLAIGCVMARQCHTNTCPVGIATQDEALRARFAGKPEMIEAFFRGIAQDVRALLARLGAQTVDPIVGQTSFLRARHRASSAWVEDLLRPPAKSPITTGITRKSQGLARELSYLLHRGTVPLRGTFPITNADRSIGARLSGEVLRNF